MKKILLITPDFYNYPEQLKKEFSKQGYLTTWFSDRPSESFVSKSLLRINRRLVRLSAHKYERRIIETAKKERFDVVVVIFGQSFLPAFYRALREALPNARFVYYLWDSISFAPFVEKNFPYFDKIASFDDLDCAQKGLAFRPLFFGDEWLRKEDLPPKFDFSYISTAKPGKVGPYFDIKNQLVNNGMHKFFSFVFIQSKLVLWYFARKSPEFRNIPKREFTFKRLPYEKAIDIIHDSEYVIDCQKENQRGLTIRTMEVLASKRKLITTNSAIANYDFYFPENIYIVDGKIDFSHPFFQSPYKEVPETILSKYSISSFCKDLLR